MLDKVFEITVVANSQLWNLFNVRRESRFISLEASKLNRSKDSARLARAGTVGLFRTYICQCIPPAQGRVFDQGIAAYHPQIATKCVWRGMGDSRGIGIIRQFGEISCRVFRMESSWDTRYYTVPNLRCYDWDSHESALVSPSVEGCSVENFADEDESTLRERRWAHNHNLLFFVIPGLEDESFHMRSLVQATAIATSRAIDLLISWHLELTGSWILKFPNYEQPEFHKRCQGPPSESVGAVGDIYLDTASPGLWGRCSDKWTLWRAGAQPVVHPTHETHVLWARPNNSQVSWFLKSTKPRLIGSAKEILEGIVASKKRTASKTFKRKAGDETTGPDNTKKPRVSAPSSTRSNQESEPAGLSSPPAGSSQPSAADAKKSQVSPQSPDLAAAAPLNKQALSSMLAARAKELKTHRAATASFNAPSAQSISAPLPRLDFTKAPKSSPSPSTASSSKKNKKPVTPSSSKPTPVPKTTEPGPSKPASTTSPSLKRPAPKAPDDAVPRKRQCVEPSYVGSLTALTILTQRQPIGY
ncbi:hypothetical protein R3P38DRAFT_3367979 [Favolaschia claudopus]|uniref:Uncharacterized protein n=1 Tax=Favolaschia claudopus TaxID=2862362 RepID=A0AAW0A6B1_9AGAR